MYDREYVRAGTGRGGSGYDGGDGPGGAGGPGGGGGGIFAGGPRHWTFNTWLIVVNVAIFLIGALVLSQPQFLRPVETQQRFSVVAVTADDLRQGDLDRRQLVDVQVAPNGVPQVVRGFAVTAQGNRQQIIGVQQVQYMPVHEAWGHFSTGKGFFGLEVWRFVTFQFLHGSMLHLLMNMLGLWFVGGLVEEYLGSRRYAAFYLTCGIFGAVAYLLLNLMGHLLPVRIPGLLFNDVYTPLVGASAGIFGVLMAAAFIRPTAIVQVFFVLPMKLRTAVYCFVGIALFNLLYGSANAGGEAAHMGGAVAGYFFIRNVHLLRDFFDIVGNSRAPTGGGRPGRPGRAGGPSVTPPAAPRRLTPAEEAEVDRILAKVRASGLHSLSDAEKSALAAASRKGS
ncbi:MAG: rhomboid family intramembrane serine protease [bacterium]